MQTWNSTAIAVPSAGQQQFPVQQGRPPLVYMVELSGMLRIVDVTSSAELVSMPVQGRTIVSITADKGLKIGGQTMQFPSLSADHTYAIYVGSSEGQQNVIRSGTVRPGLPITGQPMQMPPPDQQPLPTPTPAAGNPPAPKTGGAP